MRYKFLNEETNQTVSFDWDDPNPPTDSDLDEIFAEAAKMQPEPSAPSPFPIYTPSFGQEPEKPFNRPPLLQEPKPIVPSPTLMEATKIPEVTAGMFEQKPEPPDITSTVTPKAPELSYQQFQGAAAIETPQQSMERLAQPRTPTGTINVPQPGKKREIPVNDSEIGAMLGEGIRSLNPLSKPDILTEQRRQDFPIGTMVSEIGGMVVPALIGGTGILGGILAVPKLAKLYQASRVGKMAIDAITRISITTADNVARMKDQLLSDDPEVAKNARTMLVTNVASSGASILPEGILPRGGIQPIAQGLVDGIVTTLGLKAGGIEAWDKENAASSGASVALSVLFGLNDVSKIKAMEAPSGERGTAERGMRETGQSELAGKQEGQKQEGQQKQTVGQARKGRWGDVKVKKDLIDLLTGLPNNTVTKGHIEKTFSEKEPEIGLSVDADHAKSINDRFGHAEFDRILGEIGTIFEKHFPDKFIGREGGEEFFGNLGKGEINQGLILRVSAFLDDISNTIKVGPNKESFTMSAGLSIGKHKLPDGKIEANSDKMAYLAKKAGRNQFVVDNNGKQQYNKSKDIGKQQYVVDFLKENQIAGGVDELVQRGELDARAAQQIRDIISSSKTGETPSGQGIPDGTAKPTEPAAAQPVAPRPATETPAPSVPETPAAKAPEKPAPPETPIAVVTENSRVAKINGTFEVVEILQGYGSQGAKIQRENGEIIELDGDAYLNTVDMHNEKMAYRAKAPEKPAPPETPISVTDKTLVVDPDMVPEPIKASIVERFSTGWEKIENDAKERMRKRSEGSVRLFSGLPLDDMTDLTIIGTAKMIRGTIDAAKWSSEMIKEFGDTIKPHLDNLYKEAKSTFDQYVKRMQERSYPKTVEGAQQAAREEFTAQGRYYKPQGHEETKSKAAQIISEKGIEGAHEHLMQQERPSAETTDLARQLSNEYRKQIEAARKSGDKEAESKAKQKQISALGTTAIRLTEMGQAIEAVKIMLESPEAALYVTQKLSQKAIGKTSTKIKQQVVGVAQRVKSATDKINQKTAERIIKQLTEEEKKDIAAADLAQRIWDYVKPAKAGKTKDEQKLIAALFGVAKEKLPEKLKLSVNTNTDLLNAIAKMDDKGRALWKKSISEQLVKVRDAALEQEKARDIPNEVRIKQINQTYDDIKYSLTENLDLSISAPILEGAVREQIKNSGIDLKKIVREHYMSQQRAGESLAQKLIGQGLNQETAIKLSQRIQESFAAMASKEKEAALANLLKVKEPITKKSMFQALTERYNLGALSEEKYYESVRKMLGLSRIDDNAIGKLQSLVERHEASLNESERTAIEGELEQLIGQDKNRKQLDKMLKMLLSDKVQKKRMSEFDKVVQLSNMGALSEEEYYPLISQRFGVSTLTHDLADRLRTAIEKHQTIPEENTALKDEARDAIQVILQELDNPTLARKWITAARLLPLTSPKTHERNVLSTVVLGQAERANTMLASAIDMVYSKLTNQPRAIAWRRGSNIWKEFYSGAPEYMTALKRGATAGWKGIEPSGTSGAYELRGFSFKSKPSDNALQRVFNKSMLFVEKVVGTGLRAPDYASWKASTETALQEQAYLAGKSQGLSGEKLDKFIGEYVKKAPDEAVKVAEEFASRIRLTDDNVISNAILKFRRGINKIGEYFNIGTEEAGVGDLVILYGQAPGALLMRGLEYSPVGFVKSTGDLIKAVATKDVDRAEFERGLSRAIIGTFGFTLAGAWLHSLGVLTGDEEENKNVKQFKQEQTGERNYQVNVSAIQRLLANLGGNHKDLAQKRQNDLLVSYDWLQPFAISVALGAEADRVRKEKDFDPYRLMTVPLKTILEQPLLTGIRSIFADTYGVTKGAIVWATKIPQLFVPTLLYDVRKITDNTVRETYDKNPAKMALNQVITKIPFVEKTLPEAAKTFGVDGKVFYADDKNTWYNVLFNPMFINRYKIDPVTQAVLSPYMSEEFVNQFPRMVQRRLAYSKRTVEESIGRQITKEDIAKHEWLSQKKDSYGVDLNNKEISTIQKASAEVIKKKFGKTISNEAFEGMTPEEQADAFGKEISNVMKQIRSRVLADKFNGKEIDLSDIGNEDVEMVSRIKTSGGGLQEKLDIAEWVRQGGKGKFLSGLTPKQMKYLKGAVGTSATDVRKSIESRRHTRRFSEKKND